MGKSGRDAQPVGVSNGDLLVVSGLHLCRAVFEASARVIQLKWREFVARRKFRLRARARKADREWEAGRAGRDKRRRWRLPLDAEPPSPAEAKAAGGPKGGLAGRRGALSLLEWLENGFLDL